MWIPNIPELVFRPRLIGWFWFCGWCLLGILLARFEIERSGKIPRSTPAGLVGRVERARLYLVLGMRYVGLRVWSCIRAFKEKRMSDSENPSEVTSRVVAVIR